jgi:acyl-CoA synthetase (AMP-forming)/AMP-acid ligase II
VGVIWLPPYHDMGLIGGLLQPIYSGFPVHLMSPVTFLQRPIRWLEAISKHRGTISAAPNFAYELCVKRIRPEQLAALDLSSWQVAANGAEPIRADTLRQFSETFATAGFDARAFFPCFGMAETTLYVTGAPLFTGVHTMQASREALAIGAVTSSAANADSIELVSSGRPDEEVEVRIVNPQSEQECEAGEVGEIWVSGETVAAGYWERPQETADTFQARLPGSDRTWLRTGDLGSLVDGELYVTGRIKDLIIIRGQNHYPHDIEATVCGLHPALRPQGAAAFSITTADGEQLGLVLEVERSHAGSDLAPVEAIVRDAVSRQHQLQIDRLAFVRHGSIPKTSSGKIQRYLTRQRLLAGEMSLIEASEEGATCQ